MSKVSIDDLAEKAGWHKPGSLPSDWDEEDFIVTRAQMFKFANLIIDECVIAGQIEFYNDNHVFPTFPGEGIRNHFDKHEGEIIQRAMDFAHKAHDGQVRTLDGAMVPYYTHCLNVGGLLSNFIDDPEIIAAGVLHDVVEDTETTLKEIERQFGERVAALVAEVTDQPNMPKDLRRQSQIDKAASRELMSDSARMIKIADKIDNIQSAVRSNWSKASIDSYIEFSTKVVEACKQASPNQVVQYLCTQYFETLQRIGR